MAQLPCCLNETRPAMAAQFFESSTTNGVRAPRAADREDTGSDASAAGFISAAFCPDVFRVLRFTITWQTVEPTAHAIQ